MEVSIRKMGNSQGVLIPKPILAQVGPGGTADLQVRDGVIEIRLSVATRAKDGPRTHVAWLNSTPTRFSGRTSPTRAMPSSSGNERESEGEGRRYLARPARPHSAARSGRPAVRRHLAGRDERSSADGDRCADDHRIAPCRISSPGDLPGQARLIVLDQLRARWTACG